MQKLSYRHIVLFSLSLSCLLTGSLIYFLFRPNTIFLNLLSLRSLNLYRLDKSSIKEFIINYGADILWCFSLYLITIALYEKRYLKYSGKVVLLFLPFLTEVAQYFKILPGTFDWYDMLTYALVFCIFSGIIPSLNILKYEKG